MNDRCPCGGIILADTEEWKTPVCDECYTALGEPDEEPEDMNDKKPVKVRLGEKYAKAISSSTVRWQPTVEEDLTSAYVAGFDRAKALCLDFTVRYVDRRLDPPLSEDEEREWMKHFEGKKQPSHHMASIGEGV